MKRLIGFSLFLSLCINGVKAQDRPVDRVSERIRPGLMRMGESPFYYTYYYRDQKQENSRVKAVVEVFNDTLGDMRKVEFELPDTDELVAINISDQNTFLITVDPKKNSRAIMALDQKGEVAKSKSEEGLPKEAMLKENFPQLYSVSPEDYLVFYPAYTKSGGYRMAVVDRELEERWSETYAPKTGSWEIVKMSQSGPMLLLLRKEITGTAPDQSIAYNVLGIEAVSGNTMFTVALTDSAKALQYPTFFNTDMGQIVTGGVYFNNGKPDAGKPDGIFFTTMSPSGDVQAQAVIPWDSVVAMAGSKELTALLSGRSFILPRGVTFTPPETRMMVAEVLSASGGGVQSTDLLTFHVNREGTLKKIARIEKTDSEVAARTLNSIVDAVDMLHSGAPFSYQGIVVGNKGSASLAYTDVVDTVKLIFHSLDTVATEKMNSISITSLAAPKGSKESSIIPPILISPHGRVLYYSYRDNNMHLSSRKVMPQSVSGNTSKKSASPSSQRGAGMPVPKKQNKSGK